MVSIKSLSFVLATFIMPTIAQYSVDGVIVNEALAPFVNQPGVSEFLSIYSKYENAPGFSAFQETFINKLFMYGMTAVPAGLAIPTATDAGGILNDKAYQQISKDVVAIITEYVATETNLPKDTKSSMLLDFAAVQSIVDAKPTAIVNIATAKSTEASVSAAMASATSITKVISTATNGLIVTATSFATAAGVSNGTVVATGKNGTSTTSKYSGVAKPEQVAGGSAAPMGGAGMKILSGAAAGILALALTL